MIGKSSYLRIYTSFVLGCVVHLVELLVILLHNKQGYKLCKELTINNQVAFKILNAPKLYGHSLQVNSRR